MKRSISATELSKMAFCELNVIQKQIPSKSQRNKMNAGIKAHNHFEKTMKKLGNARIYIPTQHTDRTKTTQRTFTTYLKITFVLIALITTFGYFVVKT